jgi:hypothetical protein
LTLRVNYFVNLVYVRCICVFVFVFSFSRLLGSLDPLLDAVNRSTSSLDKSSIASMLRKHQVAEDAAGGGAGGGGGAGSTVQSSSAFGSQAGGAGAGGGFGGGNKVLELLSVRMRPTWADSKADVAAAMDKYEATDAAAAKKAFLEGAFVFLVFLVFLVFFCFLLIRC